MSDAFKSIEQGLQEALAHTRGEKVGTVHEIELPDPDVQAIRARTGLSQSDFARSIGVRKGTLLNWEQRRRSPEAIDALLDIWPIFEAFQLTYVSKGLLLEQEKNASAPSPSGPSAGAKATARPARGRARTAPRG